MNENCVQKIPAGLEYDSSMYNLIMGTNVYIAAPTYQNVIEEFYLAEGTSLPDGLTLNSQTGEITGMPTQESGLNTYTIYGKNQVGVTFTTIIISVRKGTCKAEGIFPTANIGDVIVFNCSNDGSILGTIERACVLGETDGEWQIISDSCLPASRTVNMLVIAIVVIVVVVVVVIVIIIIVCVKRRTKTVGSANGRSSSKKSLPIAASSKLYV